MRPLTERQSLVLAIVREHTALKGYPPTLREIGERVGIRSTNGVNDHLKALERKGYVRRDDVKSRGIVVIPHDDDPPPAAIAKADPAIGRSRAAVLHDRVQTVIRELLSLDALLIEMSREP